MSSTINRCGSPISRPLPPKRGLPTIRLRLILYVTAPVCPNETLKFSKGTGISWLTSPETAYQPRIETCGNLQTASSTTCVSNCGFTASQSRWNGSRSNLLRYLLSRSGEVVRKEELLEAVWPGVLVVDASLATAVSKLRKVLGRAGSHPDCFPRRLSHRGSCGQDLARTRPPSLRRRHPEVPNRDPASDLRARPTAMAAGDGCSGEALPSLWLLVFLIGPVTSRGRKTAAPQPVSLAILPFQNDSGTQSLDYLRSALPDEMAHALLRPGPLQCVR